MRQLRLWTGIVLLGLLVVVTVAGILIPSFHAEPAFYWLVAGMVSGLFGAEIVKRVTDRSDHP
jgi:hypothetical protein